MTHENAVERIGDLLRGNLAGTTERAVLAHATGCYRCRAVAMTYVTLSESIVGPAAQDVHPLSDRIVDHALGRKDPSIAEHVASCPTCRLELDATARAEQELAGLSLDELTVERFDDEPVERRRSRWLGIAAAIAIVALAYPAFRGLQLSGAPSWTGPVRLELLQSPLRSGGDEVTVVGIEPGQPHLVLAVAWTPPDAEVDAGSYRFAVRDAAGREVWSRGMTTGEARDYVGSAGVLTFVLPAAGLESGPHVLDVRAGSAVDAPIDLSAPFRIVRR